MAAKAKTSKKKQNKKKEEERRRLEEEEEEENELEFQKACLEIRVKELETLNLGLKQKCNYLETQNDVYKVQLEETREEKDDMVSHLTRKLSEQTTISKELEERLIGMQRARSDDLKGFQQTIKIKDREFQDMKEKLEENIQALELKLASIDDFQQNKTNTERKIKELESTIETERQLHIAKYDELERKMILYRAQVKDDAVEKLYGFAKEIQELGKMSLNAAIKSAISANLTLNANLEKVSRNNVDLRSQLDSFKKQLTDKRRMLGVLEKDKKVAQRKCVQYRKILELSLEKQIELDKGIKSVENLKKELEKVRREHLECKTDDEILAMIGEEIQKEKAAHDKERKRAVESETVNLMEELKQLQIIFINTAIVTKDMLQAVNSEELEFFKGRFKKMITKIYETACNFANLSEDIKARLRLPVPQITEFTKFGFS